MVDQIRFFAGAARNLEGKSAGEYMPGMTSMIRREPVGVIGQVTPWNYPMMMAVWKWAPAIAAGNTVVLKPSDTTPASTVWMANLMAEFLPAGNSIKLKPMNAFERKIIHDTIQDLGLSSESDGEDPNRFVVIYPA